MGDLTRDTTKSYLWNQLAVVLDGAMLAVAGVAIGRFSGTEALGRFGWVMTSAGFAGLLAGFGFKEGVAVLLQRLTNDPAALRGLFSRCLAVRVVAALLAAIILALALGRGRSVTASTAVAAASYVFALLVANLLGAFDIALFKTHAVAFGKLAGSLVALAAILAGAAAGSTPLIFFGMALGAAVAGAFYFVPLRALATGPRKRYGLSAVFGISLTFWAVALLNYFLQSFASPFVLKVAAVPEKEIGIFFAALVAATAANKVFMGGFANVILAAFSRAHAAGHQDLKDLHSLYVRVAAVLSVPALIGVVLFAPQIAAIPLKNDVAATARIMRIFALALLAGRLLGGGAHSSVLFAAGGHRTALVVRAVFALISVVFTYMAAATGRIEAAAVASGAAGVLVVAAEYLLVRSRHHLRMPFATLFRLVFACALATLPSAALAMLGGSLALVLAAVIFTFGAIFALAVVRPFSPGEVDRMGAKGLAADLMKLFEAKHDARQ